MTPSQLLTRIEALGSIDAKYIDKLRKQIEDPTKNVKSEAIVKFLFSKKLITKMEAVKLLASPNKGEFSERKRVGDSTGASSRQAQPVPPAAETVARPKLQPIPGTLETPFNDDPDYVPVRDFNPMVIFAFLNFHRRFILGGLLLAVVGYFLMQPNVSSPDSDDDNNNNALVAQESEPTSPSGEIELEPSLAESTEPSVSEAPQRTVNQQINLLLASANKWRNISAAGAVYSLKVRYDRINKLAIRDDIKPRQLAYCVQERIKALGAMSELNQKVSGGVEGLDEMIAEAVQAHEGSEDEEIAALVKSVLVGHLARRFAGNQNEENFAAFKVAFFDKRDAIALSDTAQLHMTYAIRDATVTKGDDPGLRELAGDHLSRVLFWSDDVVVDLAKNLHFPKADWRSLESRIKTGSPGAETDVQILLASVDKHHELPVIVYSTITLAIKWYHDAGEIQKAQRFLGQLEEISQKITSERIRKNVEDGIATLKTSFSK